MHGEVQEKEAVREFCGGRRPLGVLGASIHNIICNAIYAYARERRGRKTHTSKHISFSQSRKIFNTAAWPSSNTIVSFLWGSTAQRAGTDRKAFPSNTAMRVRGLASAVRGCRRLAVGGEVASGGWLGVASLRLDPPVATASWSYSPARHASRWPFPKSGGVEGFPEQYMRSIKQRVVPKHVTEGTYRSGTTTHFIPTGRNPISQLDCTSFLDSRVVDGVCDRILKP